MSLLRKIVLLMIFLSLPLWGGQVGLVSAEETDAKRPVYGGMIVKIDAGAAALTAGLSKGRLQQYEIAMNWRIIDRLYPTLELGYAGGKTTQGDTLSYNAHGGFARVGLDFNPLKKHPESPHALLIGIRIGTGIQPKRTDCWGEVVAGCQVEVAKLPPYRGGRGERPAFYMGWQGRLKILFTREKEGLTAEEMAPIYIPGFGDRGSVGWGLSYHLGWKF